MSRKELGSRNCKHCTTTKFIPNYSWQIYCNKECSKKAQYKRRVANGREADILRKFGITPKEYSHLLDKQGGVCAICGKKETAVTVKRDRVKRLAVDHDHVSGKIRGLLCQVCNKGIGMFKDSPYLLSEAIIYLVSSGTNSKEGLEMVQWKLNVDSSTSSG